MDLSRVIIGSIVTEKAERLKVQKTYTLRVASDATKIDVRNALKKFYDIEVSSVRSMRTTTKTRSAGAIVKRQPFKKMLVTLAKDSKQLDISAFKA